MPLFPRLGPLEAAFPTVISTIGALRLPAPNTRSLMDSLPRPTLRLAVYSLAAETHRGVWPDLFRPVPRGRFERGRSPDLPGSWRILPIPLPRSRTPAGLGAPHRYRRPAADPSQRNVRSPAFKTISELNHAASVLAVYASSSASLHSHARLASGGWLAFAGRDSNPLDSNERFLFSVPNFLLSQVYPGATIRL